MTDFLVHTIEFHKTGVFTDEAYKELTEFAMKKLSGSAYASAFHSTNSEIAHDMVCFVVDKIQKYEGKSSMVHFVNLKYRCFLWLRFRQATRFNIRGLNTVPLLTHVIDTDKDLDSTNFKYVKEYEQETFSNNPFASPDFKFAIVEYWRKHITEHFKVGSLGYQSCVEIVNAIESGEINFIGCRRIRSYAYEKMVKVNKELFKTWINKGTF